MTIAIMVCKYPGKQYPPIFLLSNTLTTYRIQIVLVITHCPLSPLFLSLEGDDSLLRL